MSPIDIDLDELSRLEWECRDGSKTPEELAEARRELGEWVELHNTLAVPVQLAGLELVDASGNVGTVSEAVVPAGGLAVLGRGPESCGPTPTAWYTASFSLNNGGDAVELYAGPTRLDAVGYGSAGARPDESWADDGGTWCAAVPSPGAPNPSCE